MSGGEDRIRREIEKYSRCHQCFVYGCVKRCGNVKCRECRVYGTSNQLCCCLMRPKYSSPLSSNWSVDPDVWYRVGDDC